jgi:hypothetical protein
MPGPQPSDVARWVHTHCPTETLVLTAHDRDAFGSAKLTAGLVEMEAEAAGFIIIFVSL